MSFEKIPFWRSRKRGRGGSVLVGIGGRILCNNFEFMFHNFGCQTYKDLALLVLRYQLVSNVKIYVPGETPKRGDSAASLEILNLH